MMRTLKAGIMDKLIDVFLWPGIMSISVFLIAMFNVWSLKERATGGKVKGAWML